MSFMRSALRLSAVNAIATATDYDVSDSSITPIDEKVTEETHPVISVYTDSSSGERQGTEILGEDEQNLIIQIGLTQKTKVPVVDPVTGERTEKELWVIAPTDTFMEITLDLMCRQVLLALTDATNEWAEMFRKVSNNINKIETIRGASEGGDDRFAGRQMIFEIKMKSEPGLNTASDAVCYQFLELLEQDEEYARIAGLMRATLETGGSGDVVTELRRRYGLTSEMGENLLLATDAVITN